MIDFYGVNVELNSTAEQQYGAGAVHSSHLQFLLGQNLVHLCVSFSRYDTNINYLDAGFWAKYFFLLKLHIPCVLSYVVDGAQYKATPSHLAVQFNVNDMVSDIRASAIALVAHESFALSTIGQIFPSSIWLERELADFTGLNFTGLRDTRRLLLDYFEDRQAWQTHLPNDKNYNNSLYDICLVF